MERRASPQALRFFSCLCSGRPSGRCLGFSCGTVTPDCALGFILPVLLAVGAPPSLFEGGSWVSPAVLLGFSCSRRGATPLRPMSVQLPYLESFSFFSSGTSIIHVLEGAPSFAFSAKGGLLRSNSTILLLSRVSLAFVAPYPNLSSRPERPDFFFRAELWRVGPRRGGICFFRSFLCALCVLPSVNDACPDPVGVLPSFLLALQVFLNFQL